MSHLSSIWGPPGCLSVPERKRTLTAVSKCRREDQAAAKTRGMDTRFTGPVAAVPAVAGPTCAFPVSVGLWGPDESPQEPPGLQEGRDLLCLIFRRSCLGPPAPSDSCRGTVWGPHASPGLLWWRREAAVCGGEGGRVYLSRASPCSPQAFLGAPRGPSGPVSPSRPPSTWPTGSAGGSVFGRPAAGAARRSRPSLRTACCCNIWTSLAARLPTHPAIWALSSPAL